MGNATSVTKATRQQHQHVQAAAIATAQAKVADAQNAIVQGVREQQHQPSHALVGGAATTPVDALIMLETAKKQLARNDAPFSKADLVCIVTALDPSKLARAREMSAAMTVPQLTALIRTIIYDPARYMQNGVVGTVGEGGASKGDLQNSRNPLRLTM